MARNARFTGELTREVLLGAVMLGILGGIAIDIWKTPHLIEVAYAEEVEVIDNRKEVRIEVVYNWDKARIVEEIRKAFPETPNTAVAIARCESQDLTIDIQSKNILWYGQEQSYGLFQIHAKDHDANAIRLGFGEYRTNPVHNIGYARYLYERRGWLDWSCYTKGLYKSYL